MNIQSCNRENLVSFLRDQLQEDDRLEFLIHLDVCTNCWEAVYAATKASHPHFYKRPLRGARFNNLELAPVERSGEESEDIFEVA